MADSQANDNTCVVCFKNVLYYSIGECDHPVCFECSTRMRVLCLQNECPICRQNLSKVVFTDTIQTYKQLGSRPFTDKLFERQFKIGFCSDEIKQAYEHLLENRCKICEKLPPFRTFTMLSDHMRKVHERYFCDLCVKHLKIFTSERKCYTRQELGHHRRRGDLDDTSHRGHPLCEFCEERFMDADELYRHLRKEHLYCHLCDADGRNLYYASHSALAHHFRTDHYLCEEGECAGEHLTAVFRSEIDLKAHKATVHGRNMPRGAARQARTLELQFNITPHPQMQRTPRDRDRERERSHSPPPTPVTPASIDTRSDAQFPRLSAAPAAPALVLSSAPSYRGSEGLARTDKNFPALDGASRPTRPATTPTTVAATILRNSKPSMSIQLKGQPASASNFRLTQTSAHRPAPSNTNTQKNMLDNDEFPSLAQREDYPSLGATVQPPKVTKPSVSIQLKGQPAKASNFRITPTSAHRPAPQSNSNSQSNNKSQGNSNNKSHMNDMLEDDDEYPTLGQKDDHPSLGAATVQPSKVALINSQEMEALKKSNTNIQQKKVPLSAEAFPALSSESSPAPPAPQWIRAARRKPAPAPAPAPPPTPAPPAFNPVADFPTLPANNAKMKNKKSPSQPQPRPPPPPVEDPPKLTKKEKKKNKAKENGIVETIKINGTTEEQKTPKETYAAVNANETPRDKSKAANVSDERNGNGGNGDFNLTAREYPPLGAPPGFGMTFTNSSGQTFSAPLHAYVAPPDFEPRNRELGRRLTEALTSPTAVSQFKEASRAFREGRVPAERFRRHCRDALGEYYDELFPELVALLPDIGKQQQLARGAESPLCVCDKCGQVLAPGDVAPHHEAHWPPLS